MARNAFKFRQRQTRRWWLIGITLSAAAAFAVVFVAGSGAGVTAHQAAATLAATCPTADTLDASDISVGGGRSNFEIDAAVPGTGRKPVPSAGANLTLDGASPCLDWTTKALGAGTGIGADLTSGVLVKNDALSGSGDDSFTGGTSENTPVPTIASGSIPPNKSDLLHFGIYRESNGTGKFLNLFWSRKNNPSGTIAMDFELNKFACSATDTTNCSSNGVTPVRSTGDRLIVYGLDNGGTVPTISIYTWDNTSGSWGTGSVISGGGGNNEALGSINFSPISSLDSGGIGGQDSLTFGEVSVSYKALFGTGTSGCGSFGSVYLKSRSSNTFTDELKDFIAPESVQITNCTTLATQVSSSTDTPNTAVTDTATLSGATATATGTIGFKVYGPFTTADATADTCTALTLATNGTIAGTTISYDVGTTNWTSTASYTPTAPGRYRFVATYTSGDANNASAGPTTCLDGNELVTVSKVDTTLSTAQVLVPNDSATVSPAVTGTGQVHFYLFKPGQTCANTDAAKTAAVYSTPKDISGGTTGVTGNTSTTDTLAGSHALALGTWYWLVVYDGDSGHNGSASTCTEAFTITES